MSLGLLPAFLDLFFLVFSFQLLKPGVNTTSSPDQGSHSLLPPMPLDVALRSGRTCVEDKGPDVIKRGSELYMAS